MVGDLFVCLEGGRGIGGFLVCFGGPFCLFAFGEVVWVFFSAWVHYFPGPFSHQALPCWCPGLQTHPHHISFERRKHTSVSRKSTHCFQGSLPASPPVQAQGQRRSSLLSGTAGTSGSRAMTSGGFGFGLWAAHVILRPIEGPVFVSCHFRVCEKAASDPMNQTAVIFWWYSRDYSWSCLGSGLCCREWSDLCISFLGAMLDRWN